MYSLCNNSASLYPTPHHHHYHRDEHPHPLLFWNKAISPVTFTVPGSSQASNPCASLQNLENREFHWTNLGHCLFVVQLAVAIISSAPFTLSSSVNLVPYGPQQWLFSKERGLVWAEKTTQKLSITDSILLPYTAFWQSHACLQPPYRRLPSQSNSRITCSRVQWSLPHLPVSQIATLF